MSSAALAGLIAGNLYDKYHTRNPLARRLMAGFLGAFGAALGLRPPGGFLRGGGLEGQCPGGVGRGVIDDDDLVGVPQLFQHLPVFLDHPDDGQFLAVRRDHQADTLDFEFLGGFCAHHLTPHIMVQGKGASTCSR